MKRLLTFTQKCFNCSKNIFVSMNAVWYDRIAPLV